MNAFSNEYVPHLTAEDVRQLFTINMWWDIFYVNTEFNIMWSDCLLIYLHNHEIVVNKDNFSLHAVRTTEDFTFSILTFTPSIVCVTESRTARSTAS